MISEQPYNDEKIKVDATGGIYSNMDVRDRCRKSVCNRLLQDFF